MYVTMCIRIFLFADDKNKSTFMLFDITNVIQGIVAQNDFFWFSFYVVYIYILLIV